MFVPFPKQDGLPASGSWLRKRSTGVCSPRRDRDCLRGSCTPAASCLHWHLGGTLQRGSLETTLPGGLLPKQLSRLHRAQSALGPNGEYAFSQQHFGLESGAQAAVTRRVPSGGIQNPHEGECGGRNTWHRTVHRMGSITLRAADRTGLIVTVTMDWGQGQEALPPPYDI